MIPKREKDLTPEQAEEIAHINAPPDDPRRVCPSHSPSGTTGKWRAFGFCSKCGAQHRDTVVPVKVSKAVMQEAKARRARRVYNIERAEREAREKVVK